MTQDLYYVDSGYLTPDSGYYVYTADAEAAVSSNATMTVAVGVIKSASSTISAVATITAVISHIEGADLVAFSNAAIATQITVIRATNVALTSVFSAAINGSRGIYVSAQADSTATIIISTTRIRVTEAAHSAAFSLAASVGKIVQGSVGSPSRTAKTITVNGNAAISATQSKFGGKSIALDGTGDYLSIATNTDFGFGTGDFTIEGWFYKTTTTTQWFIDTRTTTTQTSVAIQSNGAGSLRLFVNGALVLTNSINYNNNAWNHLAISRASGVTRFFINGVVSTTTYTDATNYGTTKPLVVGAQFNGTTAFNGYIDEIRVTKGVGRYTTTFTAPAAAFTNDTNTVLLIHGDTDISDDPGAGSGLQAAFSLACDATKIIGGTVQEANADLSSLTSLSVTVIKQANANAALSSSASVSAAAEKLVVIQTTLTSTSELFVSRKAYGPRPHDLVNGNISAPTYYNTSISKFGSASFIGNGNTGGKSSLRITQYEDYVIEAWIYPTTADQTLTNIIGQPSFGGPWLELLSGALRFRVYLANPNDPDGSLLSTPFTDTVDLPLNQWNHILLVKSGGTNGYLSIYKNGTRVYATGDGVNPVFPYTYGYTNLTNVSFFVKGSSTVLVDEAMFVKDSSYGYDATQSSITVPTTVRLNDNTVTGLWHLNSNALDDTTLVQTATAAASAVTSVTATLTGPQRTSASLSAAASLSVVASKILGSSVSISSAASVSATALRIKSSSVSLSSASNLSIAPVVIRSISVTANSAFTETVVNSRTRNVAITTDAIFSELAAVVKIGNGLITLESSATLVAQVNVKTSTVVALNAAASMAVTARAIREFSLFSQDIDNFIICDVLRIRTSAVLLESSCNLTTVIGELFNVSANLTAVSSLEATSAGFINVSAALAGNATLTANNTRLKFGLASLSSLANLTADPDIVKVAQANISAAASLNISPTAIKSAQTTLTAFVAELAAVVKIGQGLVTLNSSASLSAVATVVRKGQAQIQSQASVTATALRIKSFAAGITSAASVTSIVGVIKPAAAAVSAQATVTTTITRVKSATATLSSAVTQTTTALKIKSFTSQISSQATVTARITVAIVFVSANLTAVSTLSVTTNAGFSINLTAFSNAQLTATIDVIHINPKLTWMIFAEDREYSIQAENKVYSITAEDREYSIVNENREYAVTKELLTTELQGV